MQIKGYAAADRELKHAGAVGQKIEINPSTIIDGESLADRFGWKPPFIGTITSVGAHWSVAGASGYYVDIDLPDPT